MRCRARPVAYAASWLALALLLSNSENPVRILLHGPLGPLVPPVAMFIAGMAARSIVAGAAVGAGIVSMTNEGLPTGATTLLYVGVIGILIIRSAKSGAYDSLVEYLSYPGKLRLSPILAAASSAALANWLNLDVVTSNFYYPSVALAALVAARQDTPWTAMAIASLAGLGPLWAPAVALYASFAPLPPISCGTLPIGLLVGVEAETSPGRALVSNSSTKWKDRVIACSSRREARVGLRDPYTIIVYSKDWRSIALSIASRISQEHVVVDLDSSDTRDQIATNTSRGLEAHEITTLVSEAASRGRLPIIGSCEKPVELLVGFIPPGVSAIVGSCTPPQGRLFPARRGDMIAILGDTGDPIALNSTLQALAPGIAGKLASMVGRGLLVATPYCGPRLALVSPPGSSHE